MLGLVNWLKDRFNKRKNYLVLSLTGMKTQAEIGLEYLKAFDKHSGVDAKVYKYHLDVAMDSFQRVINGCNLELESLDNLQ